MNYGEKIKAVRNSLDMTQQKFSEFTEISISTLKKVESGVSNPNIAVIEKIIAKAELFKYSFWLLSENTEPQLGQISPLDVNEVDKPDLHNINVNDRDEVNAPTPIFKNKDKKHIELPFYEVSASAGVGLLAEVEERPKTISFEPYWLRNEIGVCPSNVFLMMVEGDSMQPTLKNGSMIMVNRDVDNLSDGIYVMRYDENLLVKRLQMLPGGIIRVKSDNSMYDPWEIKKSQLDGVELALIGRVVWTGQKM